MHRICKLYYFAPLAIKCLPKVNALGVPKQSLRCNHADLSNMASMEGMPRRRGSEVRALPNDKIHIVQQRNTLRSNALTSLRGGAAILATAVAPPLGVWIGPALVCALSYAAYNIFIKKASAAIDPILGGVLLQFVAALMGTLLYASKLVAGKPSTIPTQNSGIVWAVAAGVAVGAAEILSFVISSMGVQAMQSIPIVVGGSVLFGTVLGSAWLKEKLTVRGWCGVMLISAGIALVGMDPGTKASLH